MYGVLKTTSILLLLGLLSACVTTGEGDSEADWESAEATYVELGLGYLRLGNREAARLNFNKALEIDDGSAGANNGMAVLFQREGMQDRAEEHFQKAIRADGDFARARNNYGSFLYEQERYEEAFEQFERAGQNLDYGRRPLALVNLGRAALKLGREARAVEAFERALSLDSDHERALLELADLHFQQGRYPDAKQYIDEFGENAQHTARSLWLGIRLERIFGNRDKEASYAMALRNLHRYSDEYLEYQEWSENQ